MLPFTSKDIFLTQISWLLLSSLLAGCGPEKYAPDVPLFESSLHKASIVNGTGSDEDCYDVGLLAMNTGPNSVTTGTCSAYRISTGVFVTAAHCVTQTRPNTTPPPSKWSTQDISFSLNPSMNGRSSVNQILSIQVITPPAVANFSNAQWSQTANDVISYDQVATDVAIVITSDTQQPWDRYLSAGFATPSIGDFVYPVGYGNGTMDVNGNFSNAGRRRLGTMQTKFENAQIITFYVEGNSFAAPGDSGAPFYAANGNQDRRQIVGMMSVYAIAVDQNGKPTQSVYNYSPNLANLGGQQNFQWITNALQQATNAAACMKNAYYNSTGQCLL